MYRLFSPLIGNVILPHHFLPPSNEILCYFRFCKAVVSPADLADHIERLHVASQRRNSKAYKCFWEGCKVSCVQTGTPYCPGPGAQPPPPTNQSSARGSPPTNQSRARGSPPTNQSSARGSTPTNQSSARGSVPTNQPSARGSAPTNQPSARGLTPY